MSADAPEREFKFAVDDAWTVPALDDLCRVGPEERVAQIATYYDTADVRLARAGASLRYRDDDGWTVKLPVNDHARGELVRAEHVFPGGPGTPPPPALELVAARVRTARLVPVARLRTVRRQVVLQSGNPTLVGDEAPLATLTDDDCTVLGGPVPGRFREVELELAPGADDDLVAPIVTRLRASGASDADPTPKVARALGPAAAAPPDVVSHPVGTPATVDAVIRHALSDAVLMLVTSDPVVRIGHDIEGVHQARVATRRLRSHLRTFHSLLDPTWSEPLRAELGWLGAELGAVRDADVLLDRLRNRIRRLDEADQVAAQPLLDRLAHQQAEARAVLLDGLRSPRYLGLLDQLVEAAHRPRVVMLVGTSHTDTLRALVRKPWRRLRESVDALDDPAPDPALHAVRIRAKRARYAAEVVEPAFGKPARDFAKALTRIQDVLGEHQDAVVAGAWLRATALTLGDARAVYAAGELGAAERVAADASRAAWPAAWRAASRARLRRWL